MSSGPDASLNLPADASLDHSITFRCSEGGVKSCDWEASASNEELLIFQVEQHARNRHNLVLDEDGKNKIRARLRPVSHPASA